MNLLGLARKVDHILPFLERSVGENGGGKCKAAELNDVGEIPERVVGRFLHAGETKYRYGNMANRIAVRLGGSRHRRRSESARGSCAIVNDNRLAKLLASHLGECACDEVR